MFDPFFFIVLIGVLVGQLLFRSLGLHQLFPELNSCTGEPMSEELKAMCFLAAILILFVTFAIAGT